MDTERKKYYAIFDSNQLDSKNLREIFSNDRLSK